MVRLLDVDAELAARVPEDELRVAAQNVVASVHRFPPGDADIRGCAGPDCAGLLVIEGLLTRDVVFAGEYSRELLGAGDLLRPWDLERDFIPPFSNATWTVMQATTIAHLDLRVLRVGARWPGLVDEIIGRTLHRSRWLAIRLAISTVNRVDERLLLFFWHAAGRWGRVTGQGVILPFQLTHEVLAELVGAQRPSVTTALNALRRRGEIEILDDEILLAGDPPGQGGAGLLGGPGGPRSGPGDGPEEPGDGPEED